MRRRPDRGPRFEPLEPRQLLASSVDFWVGFRSGIRPAAERRILARVGATLAESLPGNLTRATVDPGTDLDAAIARLSRTPGVRYAERDRDLTVDAYPVNDPYFVTQWGLSQANDVDIDAPEAWSMVGGGKPVLVAVIDSGLAIDHPDLASRIWTNPREVPGNGLDDDGNGYADDVHGWNFAENTANLNDEVMHGTHVAGIIAAQTNNGQGVAGVNPGAVLMPLKFIDGSGTGDTSDAVRAIYYAVRNGARVINASWGGASNSRALSDAIRYAGSHGVVFVTAAGNDGQNLDAYRSYPASYRLSTMLSVAAINSSGQVAGFSNRGVGTVSIAAPGVDVRSTLGSGDYALMSGTSMATPFVTGVASLLIGAIPGLSAAQVVQRIIATAKPLGSLQGKVIAGGIVDAARALNPALAATPTTPRRTTPRATAATGVKLGAGDRIRAELFASSEYFLAHGASNVGYVRGLYTDILGRAPVGPEVSGASRRLSRGLSRTALARELLATDEAARTKVALWYLDELAAPASLGRLKAYGPVMTLARRLRAGVGESRVHSQLLGSSEFTSAAGGDWTRMAELLYQATLARSAAPDESAYLASRLGSGVTAQQAALVLLMSDEGRRTRAARWLQSDMLRAASLETLKVDVLAVQLAGRLVD